jgi:hypothetical protein
VLATERTKLAAFCSSILFNYCIVHCILFSLSQCRCRRFACFCLGWLLLLPALRKYFIQIDELASLCVWSVDFGGAQRVTLRRNKKTLNKVAFSFSPRASRRSHSSSNRLNMYIALTRIPIIPCRLRVLFSLYIFLAPLLTFTSRRVIFYARKLIFHAIYIEKLSLLVSRLLCSSAARKQWKRRKGLWINCV